MFGSCLVVYDKRRVFSRVPILSHFLKARDPLFCLGLPGFENVGFVNPKVWDFVNFRSWNFRLLVGTHSNRHHQHCCSRAFRAPIFYCGPVVCEGYCDSVP